MEWEIRETKKERVSVSLRKNSLGETEVALEFSLPGDLYYYTKKGKDGWEKFPYMKIEYTVVNQEEFMRKFFDMRDNRDSDWVIKSLPEVREEYKEIFKIGAGFNIKRISKRNFRIDLSEIFKIPLKQAKEKPYHWKANNKK